MLRFPFPLWAAVAHAARQAHDGTRYERLFECEVHERLRNHGNAFFLQNGLRAAAKWYVYDMEWIVFRNGDLDRNVDGWHRNPETCERARLEGLPYTMDEPIYNRAGWGDIVAHQQVSGRPSTWRYEYVLLKKDLSETAFGVCREAGKQPPADPDCVLL